METREKYLLVTAGGSGTRMGAGMPKQFLPIGGRPILIRTLERFIEAVPEVHIVTVLPKDHIPYWKDLCVRYQFDHPQRIVAGGITRFHSVRAGLERVPAGAIVAIHDGVRPLISAGLIRRLFDSMSPECRALIPVLPVTDTLKRLERTSDGRLCTPEDGAPAPDRSVLFGAQTPQMFYSEDIIEAYHQAYDTAFTDDASVAAKAGIPLGWAEGERFNLKITTPDDILLAEAILAAAPKGR